MGNDREECCRSHLVARKRVDAPVVTVVFPSIFYMDRRNVVPVEQGDLAGRPYSEHRRWNSYPLITTEVHARERKPWCAGDPR